MVLRRWLIAQVALLGVLATLVIPSSSSALLSGVPVYLTASGPSPAVQRVPAGLFPVWINQDTVTHSVTFASGCSIQVAPGARAWCTNAPGTPNVVGNYPYTVDGTVQASIDVTAMGRSVTLVAKRHGIARGTELLLHGKLQIAQLSPPMIQGPRMPVVVLARPDRYHPFHRIAVVLAKPGRPVHNLSNVYSAWHLRVRPRARTIYIVEANSQPPRGQYWQQAWSKPFRVGVAKR